MNYDGDWLGSTFYSNGSRPYRLEDYQPGCGLRRNNSFYPDRRRNQYEQMTTCCQSPPVNFHQQCNCSLRIQPKCGCCCGMLPSLYHKLLSAPYTKICKQKTPTKEQPKQKQKQNPAPIQQVTIPVRPQPTFTIQAPQPVYQQLPAQQIYQSLIPPQQIIQPQAIQPQIIQQQPQPIFTIFQPNQPVQQPLTPIIRNSVPLTQNQLSNISFQTIPFDNTQKSIRLVSPPPPHSTFYEPPRLRQPKISIVVPEAVDSTTIVKQEKQEPDSPIKQTISQQEQIKQRPSRVSFAVPQQDKRSQVSVAMQKFQPNPRGFDFMAVQAQQNMANLRMSQGQSLSVSQQKSQQVSFSSQITQSSKSQSRQMIQKMEQTAQKFLTQQEMSDNKTISEEDAEIHVISEGEEED